MTRIDEIREKLAKADLSVRPDLFDDEDWEFIDHAPADVAWLCDEVERLRDELEETQILADARWAKLVRHGEDEERLRAEVERLKKHIKPVCPACGIETSVHSCMRCGNYVGV